MDRLADPGFLVVDDFPTMRRLARALLREIGRFDVAEAGDGAAALALLKARRFDVVISDIRMPLMSGFELLVAIKADPALLHLPVLLASAEWRHEDLTQAARLGAAGCLAKPFTKDALRSEVQNTLFAAA
jgi:two-component system, chemotaxis family, chemotaxis protein CheY